MEDSKLKEKPSLSLTRRFNSPPEKVWRTWIEPDALRQWWNQADSPGWLAELDVRVGGRYRIVMRDPEGEYHDVRGVYRKVIRYSKLVVTWNLYDAPS